MRPRASPVFAEQPLNEIPSSAWRTWRGRLSAVVLLACVLAAGVGAAHPGHTPIDALAAARLRIFLRTSQGRECMERAAANLARAASSEPGWRTDEGEADLRRRLDGIFADHQATAVAGHILETWGVVHADGASGSADHMARCTVCRSAVPGLVPAQTNAIPPTPPAPIAPERRPATTLPIARWLADLDADGVPETRANDLDADGLADLLETDTDGDVLADVVRRWDARTGAWTTQENSASFTQWKRIIAGRNPASGGGTP